MGPERDEWIDEDQIKAPQLIRKYNKYILRKDDPLRFQRETQSTSQKRKASETPEDTRSTKHRDTNDTVPE